jgi:uncharacterized protein
MSTDIPTIKKKILPILKRHGVVKAGIFGSYARGEEKKKSDLDLLVKFKGRKSLFDFIGTKLDLEESLKKNIDLVEYSTIKPLLKERILKEEIKIL